MIELLKETEGGKVTIKKKLNELLEAWNLEHPKKNDPIDVAPIPQVPQTIAEELEFNGWKPVGGTNDAAYFMPPAGYRDTEGVPISGMVARALLPESILAHYDELSKPSND